MCAYARQGLQLPDTDRGPVRNEVVVIGTCLQLVVAGAAMMEQWLDSSDRLKNVLQALKRLRLLWKSVVLYYYGVCLLDVSDCPSFFTHSTRTAHLPRKTIVIAEGSFSQDISTVEAWDILFSPHNSVKD